MITETGESYVSEEKFNMYAIIGTGGKQYKVSEGDVITVERLEVEEGQSVDFDQVFTIIDGENVLIGKPLVDGAKVIGEILKHGRDKKILVFKYKSKKNYRRRQGHRQPFTKVRITSILATPAKATKGRKPKAEKVEEAVEA